jgi:hypothetical protein
MDNLHLVHEVIKDSSHAESVATASSSASRYTHFADAVLIGNPDIQPHRPVYLTGLPDNMSGMWVVISAKHVINHTYHYTILVKLGTNPTLLAQKPSEDSEYIDINEITTRLVNQSNSFINPTINKKHTSYKFKSNEFYMAQKTNAVKFPPNYNPVKNFINSNSLTSTNYMETVHGTYRPHFEPTSYEAKWVSDT